MIPTVRAAGHCRAKVHLFWVICLLEAHLLQEVLIPSAHSILAALLLLLTQSNSTRSWGSESSLGPESFPWSGIF